MIERVYSVFRRERTASASGIAEARRTRAPTSGFERLAAAVGQREDQRGRQQEERGGGAEREPMPTRDRGEHADGVGRERASPRPTL